MTERSRLHLSLLAAPVLPSLPPAPAPPHNYRTAPALALDQVKGLAKHEIVGVPYRGSGEAARNVAGGGIQGAFAFYAQAKPLADDGKVKALAVATPQRLSSWPEVPTFAELGYPNFDYNGFVGLAAPPNTPPEIVAWLNKQLNHVGQPPLSPRRMQTLCMTA